MYSVVSITAMPEPLSGFVIIRPSRCLRSFMAFIRDLDGLGPLLSILRQLNVMLQ